MRTVMMPIDIDDKVKWITLDSDGEWYDHEEEPTFSIDKGFWMSTGVSDFLCSARPPEDASLEIYEIT